MKKLLPRSIMTFLVLAFAAAAAVALQNCKSPGTQSALRDTESGGSGGASAVAGSCSTVCSDVSTRAKRAVCYSCRCKEAFDGWLPSAEELTCSSEHVKDITTYKVKNDVEPFELEAITKYESTCLNPATLNGTCAPGSKLGQLRKGTVTVKWICRRNSFIEDWASKTEPYSDVGVIAYNSRNGASCWWDDYGGKISGEYFPSLDLSTASAEKAEEFVGVFNDTEGDGCTDCHDNDPFMFSPYLRSTGWRAGDYVRKSYFLVRPTAAPTPVRHYELTSEGASDCTSCHRIASGSTCSRWADDSMGVRKGSGHQPIVENAIDKRKEDGSIEAGPNWKLAYWMSPVHGTNFLAGTWQKWHERYGDSKKHIQKCCAERPGSEVSGSDCKWELINPEAAPASERERDR